METQPANALTTRTRGIVSAAEYGSDVIVDMLRAFGIAYAAFNPGASFRGLHDSIVNYGQNRMPEVIACTHEEISVAIAHGYVKTTGKPMVAIVHDIVGLQHASMAIFNAWCDREPVIVLGGTGPMDITTRRPWIDWIHTGLVQGNLVRDIVKWDDQPANLASVPESFIRGYHVATSEPCAPIYICYDTTIQDEKLDEPFLLPDVRRYPAPRRIQADPEALDRIAAWLVEAEHPVIVVERSGRNPAMVPVLVELAELAACPVIDRNARFNFPSTHPLDVTGADEVLRNADVILGLDLVDLFGLVTTRDPGTLKSAPVVRPDARIAHISLGDLLIRSLVHDYQRTYEVDENVIADTALALPALRDRIRERVAAAPSAVRDRMEGRREATARRHVQLKEQFLATARAHAGTIPIHPAWLALQLGAALGETPWLLANGASAWPRRLWRWERPGSYLGTSAGGGLGYGLGASIGAALGLRTRQDRDTVVVNIQADGDFLFTPSALWTAAHHDTPVLTVMYNNRSYYNSEEHAESVARQRRRPQENAPIGTAIREPDVDFAALTRSFGLWAEGPITDPAQLRPALDRAVAQVRAGRYALVDVVCGNEQRGR